MTVGAHVDILAENHNFDDPELPINQQGVKRRGVVIGEDCWIGNRATVLDGVRIGRGSVIGAAAVVTGDIPEFSVAVGSPARVLRDRRYRGPLVERDEPGHRGEETSTDGDERAPDS